MHYMVGLDDDEDYTEASMKPMTKDVMEWHCGLIDQLVAALGEIGNEMRAKSKEVDDMTAKWLDKANYKRKQKKNKDVFVEKNDEWSELDYKFKPIDVNEIIEEDLSVIPYVPQQKYVLRDVKLDPRCPIHARPLKCELPLSAILINSLISFKPKKTLKKRNFILRENESNGDKTEEYQSLPFEEKLEIELEALGISLKRDGEISFEQSVMLDKLRKMMCDNSESIKRANMSRFALQSELIERLPEIERHNERSKEMIEINVETGATMLPWLDQH